MPTHDHRDYDRQAAAFDKRAGVGSDVAAGVAASVLSLVAPRADDIILEIGAGTGEIGRHFAAAGFRYVGLDGSLGMLRRFASAGRGDVRIVADCGVRWPIGDGCVRCVFAARVLHLLDADHVGDEWARVARGGAPLIIGRRERDPTGYRELLRGWMLDALRERGLLPMDARRRLEAFIDRLRGRGALVSAEREVVQWSARGTPADAIAAWRDKGDLAGVVVDRETRDSVLQSVTARARARFGDLGQPLASAERYTITGLTRPT